ncbi:MAG: hypothetical protein K2X81_20915, partial [Candidatus Obscuribacterales bacterium]|nr:hypothetical protein [Candidatus Obscuribacterales bacterium]
MFTNDLTSSFCSTLGWNLSLPHGWTVLPKAPSEKWEAFDNIEVFSHPHDPSLSMTWMRTSTTAGLRVWAHYATSTISMGSIAPEVAQEIMSQVFALIGKVTQAQVISLPDGQRALEITEEIAPMGTAVEPMLGYHLLLPVRGSGTNTPRMQQLAFYARA